MYARTVSEDNNCHQLKPAVTWDKERLLMRRELSSGQYRPTSYFLAKTLVTFPFEAVQGALFVAISYWMVGFQASAGMAITQVAP